MYWTKPCYFIEHHKLTSPTQTDVTTGSGCRTFCTRVPYFVHVTNYVVVDRTIDKHEELILLSLKILKRCKPTDNLKLIGLHCLLYSFVYDVSLATRNYKRNWRKIILARNDDKRSISVSH